MPLSPDPSAYFEEQPDAIVFAMFDGDDRIICKVGGSALLDRAIADGEDPNDIAGAFRRHRQTIEKIASELYDAGDEMPVVWDGTPPQP